MVGTLAVALFAAALPNAVVLQPVLNMYSKPSLDADVVSQAIYGANVAIVERQEGWARIRTFDDYAGWAPLPALRIGAPYPANGRVAEVRSLFAHIYREASVTKHAPLVTVPFETKLEVGSGPSSAAGLAGGGVDADASKSPPARPAALPDWISVRLPDDRSGWVQAGDVAFSAPKLTIPEMLEFGRRFLGLPYTWGGTSSFGFDCSGFTQMLERQRGVFLPRDAQPQANWSGAAPIDRQDLAPGDLLYFGSSDKHITHTGVYLGSGKFVNATTYQTPAVRIDDLNEPRWTKLLVAIRRVK
jgi:gamma-D-glutamyl-L-lysine dipeptidyl-peptidase